MPQVELDDTEFGQLMFVLANAEGKGITWAMVNPLMMKIAGQLRIQQELRQEKATHPDPIIKQPRPDGGGKEVRQ